MNNKSRAVRNRLGTAIHKMTASAVQPKTNRAGIPRASNSFIDGSAQKEWGRRLCRLLSKANRAGEISSAIVGGDDQVVAADGTSSNRDTLSAGNVTNPPSGERAT